MLPTALVLFLTLRLLVYLSNRNFNSLKNIYKEECIRYYFKKMEKEGTHAFRK